MALDPRLRSAVVLLLAIVVVALPAAAISPTAVTPTDECVEVDHSPTEPIGDSPSKAILYFTVPPDFGGGEVTVVVDGASGEVSGIGIVASDGLSVVEIPLNAFGAHEVQEALVAVGAELVDVDLLPDGFTVDAAEPVCEPDSLVRAASTSTTTTTEAPATTSTTAPTTTASTTTTSLVELTVVEPAGTIPWGWVGLGVGLPLLLFGLWLLIGPGDCERLRREWEALQRQYDQIREAFDKALVYLDERRAVRAEIEAEIAGIEQTGSMGGSIEGGTRFKLIPEGKVTEEGYDAILRTVREQLHSALDGERMAAESVEEWKRQLEDAAIRADAARRAYEECIGKAVARLTPPATESRGAGGPVVATPAQQAEADGPPPIKTGCQDGAREARPLASPRTFRLYADFAVIVEVEEGSERNVQTGEGLAITLGHLGLDLATLGTLLGAKGAGGNLASGATGLGAGSYVKGSLGIARGSVEGLLAVKGNLGTTEFPIPVPTSPEEVLVGVLQVTAQLGALVAGKVTEWMKMNQIYRVRSTLLYQEVSVQPIQIWECKAGQWVCVETVLQYEVSRLERQPGPSQSFRIEGDVSQHQFESYINGATARAKQSIEASARAIVEFEQSNPPGPCS